MWACFEESPIEVPPVYTVISSPFFVVSDGDWRVTMTPSADAYPESVNGPGTQPEPSSTGAIKPEASKSC